MLEEVDGESGPKTKEEAERNPLGMEKGSDNSSEHNPYPRLPEG